MKRIIIPLILLALCLCGCGNKADTNDDVQEEKTIVVERKESYSNLDEIINDVEEQAEKVADSIKTNSDTLVASFKGDYEAYKNNIEQVDNFYASTNDVILDFVNYLDSAGKDYFKLIVSSVGLDEYKKWDDAIGDWYDAFDDALDEIYDSFDDALENVYDEADEVIDDAYSDKIIEYEEYDEVWGSMYETYSDSWSNCYGTYSDGWSLLYNHYSSVWSGFYNNNSDVDKIIEDADKEKTEENDISNEEDKAINETDVKESNETEKVESSTSTNDGSIRPEIKESIDKYEEFVDEYVAFMEKYSKSDGTDLSLLADYAKFIGKYADMVKDFENLEKDLNSAELVYYTEVMLRVNQKLLDVAQ